MLNEKAMKQKNSMMKKPQKKEEQEFDVFKEKLINIIEKDKTKNNLNAIYAQLRNGFNTKNTKSMSIDLLIAEIVDILKNSRCYPFIAVKAAVDISLGRANHLMKMILGKLKDVIANDTDFPSEVTLNTNSYNKQRGRVLKYWISSHKLDGVLSLEWARKATVCILNENMSDGDIGIAYEIIGSCLKDFKKNKADSKNIAYDARIRNELIKQIATIWSDYNFPEKKTIQIHSVDKYYSMLYKETEKELEKTHESLYDARTALSEKSTLVKEKEFQLMQLKDDVLRLTRENTNISEAFEKEKEKVRLTNQYWEKECINKVEKTKVTLRNFLIHEINEIRLCLDREVPNKEMALRRVLNMEEYLNKMEG